MVVVEKDSRFVPTLQVCRKHAGNGYRYSAVNVGSSHSNCV